MTNIRASLVSLVLAFMTVSNSLGERLRGAVDIKMAASKLFLSLAIFLTWHGKSRGRENISLLYYKNAKYEVELTDAGGF